MNDPDNRSVLSLHNQGRFICYFSELDPFAGKWLGFSPEKAAEKAINEIKVLFCRRWRENILNSYYKGLRHVHFISDNTIIL